MNIAFQKINKAAFEAAGLTWAVTVHEGAVAVNTVNKAICFIELKTGKMYALNGVAKMLNKFHDISEIWADDVITPKKSLSDMIAVGLNLLR
jgi:hypothetical protein